MAITGLISAFYKGPMKDVPYVVSRGYLHFFDKDLTLHSFTLTHRLFGDAIELSKDVKYQDGMYVINFPTFMRVGTYNISFKRGEAKETLAVVILPKMLNLHLDKFTCQELVLLDGKFEALVEKIYTDDIGEGILIYSGCYTEYMKRLVDAVLKEYEGEQSKRMLRCIGFLVNDNFKVTFTLPHNEIVEWFV